MTAGLYLIGGFCLTAGFLLGVHVGYGFGTGHAQGGSIVAETSDEDPRREKRTGYIPHDMRERGEE